MKFGHYHNSIETYRDSEYYHSVIKSSAWVNCSDVPIKDFADYPIF